MFDKLKYKTRIHKGMLARTSDGRDLGKIYEIEGDSFIADGAGGRTDFIADFDQVSDIQGDVVILRSGKEIEDTGAAFKGATSTQEQRLPLAEEQLDVTKRVHQAGEVRLRKRIVTEQKTMTVPVTKESVTVERVPASEGLRAGEAKIGEGEIRVPVMEEEVEVRKRPVVREEVRVAKQRQTEERRVADTVRREELDVDRSKLGENLKERIAERREERESGYGAPSRTEELKERIAERREERQSGYGAPGTDFDPNRRR